MLKQVLPQDRAPAGSVEDVRAEPPVDLEDQQRGGQHRERPPPPVRRHPRHPEALRDLPVAGAGLDQLRRSQSHPLAAGPFRGGQPAAIGVPHASGIAHDAPLDQNV